MSDRESNHKMAGNGNWNAKGHSNWVKLNVGGKIFRTTRTTLCLDPNSMLSRLVTSGINSETDEEGAILIDRDPQYFSPLLNYLRSGKIFVNPDVNPQAVLEEARFFNLQGAIEQLQKYEQPKECMTRYIIVTSDASSDYVMLEGPVEYAIMVELNGGTPPPSHLRKKLLPKVFGYAENWNLAIPLPTIFNALASRGWKLASSSGAAAMTVSSETSQPCEHRQHMFVFANAMMVDVPGSEPGTPVQSPRRNNSFPNSQNNITG